MDKKKKAIIASETFDDLLNVEYGERGTETERYLKPKHSALLNA